MGKIYDALEKFNREKVKRPPAPETSNETGVTEEMPDVEIDNSPHWQGSLGKDFDHRLVTTTDPNSLATEQFKILRSQILYPHKGSIPRTIMVTSAMEEEGKSLIAANLAISIAQGIKEHVLLVDCDIRCPGQHLLFNLSGENGLSQYLADEIPLNALLVKTPFEKLTLLPGGMPPSNPTELLSSERMRYFVEEVKSRYNDRFIVFDATPAHITAEVSVLAKHVDGILLVIRRGRTDRDVIERSVAVLGRERIIGVVFNGHNHLSRRYNYYTSYKYGG